jgi:hypothetical protein
MVRYTSVIITIFSILSVTIAFSSIPFVKSNILIKNNNYFNPIHINDTYDIFKYKIFEIKNNRINTISSIINQFRSLYHPFDGKIPLYYNLYTNST